MEIRNNILDGSFIPHPKNWGLWFEESLERFEHCLKIFTQREIEIIRLVSQGFHSKEIASLLFISKHTVDTHRKNIYRKGNFNGLHDVIHFAFYYQMQDILLSILKINQHIQNN